ncbi:hypothetical protein JCM14469_12270 [Desulfatiferula olefinivorans]
METFRHFYIETKDRLFGYLMRMTGDYQLSADILQGSYERMLSSYGPAVQSMSLLFTIARNALIDVRRRERFERHVDDVELPDDHQPEHDMMILESYRSVLEAMEHLDELERELIAMVSGSDLSYREIAGIVGISEGNVRVKVHRARCKLKDRLKRKDA